MTTVDVSQLFKFAEDVRQAATTAGQESRKVVTKGAMNIKRDSIRTLRGHLTRGGSSLSWLSVAISYDITSGDRVTFAEIGPDQSISGLGRGVEFGSRNHPPMPFLVPPFDREAPKFEAALVDAVTKAFKP